MRSRFVTLYTLIVFSCCSLVMFTGLSCTGPIPGQNIGEQFHQQTSLGWVNSEKNPQGSTPPETSVFKTGKTAAKTRLPFPDFEGMLFEKTLRERRSGRNFSKSSITIKELSQLLFAAQGVTGKIFNTPLRTAPSAGGLYPMEMYVVVNNVKDLAPGIYHYISQEHALELRQEGNFKEAIIAAGNNQEMLGDASVTIIFSAIFNRSRTKYGERAYRYVYIEAGHISQNIALQAVSLGLGSVSVGGFSDEKINELIHIDGVGEAAVYLHAVGEN